MGLDSQGHWQENHPHALLVNGEVIGTVRIDFFDAERADLRLIAIRGDIPVP